MTIIDNLRTTRSESKASIKKLVPELKIIYTDLDGTLLGPQGCLFLTTKGEYSLEPAQTIVTVLQRGIDITIVSGRNREQLREDARLLGFKNYFAELGCELIYNHGEKIITNVGNFKITEQNVYQTIQEKNVPSLLLEHYKGKLEYHTPWHENRYYTHLFRGFVNVQEVNTFLKRQGHDDLKLVDNGPIRTRSKTLNVREVHAYHLLPTAAGKAFALRKDREIRKIRKNTSIAIGDSLADLPLASEVGLLFIVANGVKEDPLLLEKIRNYKNVLVTQQERGLGWAEAVRLVL